MFLRDRRNQMIKAFSLGAVLLLLSTQNAYAVRFTTMDDTQQQQPTSEDTQAVKPENLPCSPQDLERIKLFDAFMQEQQNGMQTALDRLAKFTDPKHLQTDEYKALSKEIESYKKLMSSDDYKTMTVIYKRCNLTIPSIIQEPFWTPL